MINHNCQAGPMMGQGKVLIIGSAEKSTLRKVCHTLESIQLNGQYLPLSQCQSLPLPTEFPCIVLLDQNVTDAAISQLMSDQEIYDLLICHTELLDKKADIVTKALDFCALNNTKELSVRLERCMTRFYNYREADSDIDPKIRQNMIGSAPIFIHVLSTIERCADIDVSVLINGETGTGKELAARALHYSSARRSGPFQALNCGAIPDHLVENELFGHAKGAYTDARSAQVGLVTLAAGGTLFLDEVDALSYKAQTALLRFLQDGTYRELGGGKDKCADVRIISASNQNLEVLVEAGKFRQDLMYRLNMLVLDMPSLRDRKEDIPILAKHFLNVCTKDFSLGSKYFHPCVMDDCLNYLWPGNVRELENFVRRAYLLSDGPVITHSPIKSRKPINFSANVGQQRDTKVLQFNDAKRLAVNHFESNYITHLLDKTSGNLSEAARLAGKERRAFGRLVKKHGINRADF